MTHVFSIEEITTICNNKQNKSPLHKSFYAKAIDGMKLTYFGTMADNMTQILSEKSPESDIHNITETIPIMQL